MSVEIIGRVGVKEEIVSAIKKIETSKLCPDQCRRHGGCEEKFSCEVRAPSGNGKSSCHGATIERRFWTTKGQSLKKTD